MSSAKGGSRSARRAERRTYMIQVRNVPESLHRRLKVRAAEEGVSVSDYLTREIRRLLDRPTRGELLERLASVTREPLSPSPADLLRRERDSR